MARNPWIPNGDVRLAVWDGGIYAIRDREGWVKGDPMRCEYATVKGDDLVWTPCVEAVEYATIEPLARVNG